MVQSPGKPKVIIIGAGVGGIATAIHLARRGYRVKVVEKCGQPGGRCGRMDLDGYRFDTGATIFLMPDLYARAFASFGERLEDHVELRRLDPTYRLVFSDQSAMTLTSDLRQMGKQMESMEPGSTGPMLRYLAEGAQHYDLSMDFIVQRDFRTPQEFFSPANLLRFLRMRAFLPHSVYLKRFFQDTRLQIAFSFQDTYMGLSPRESPAAYSLMPYAELAGGIWHPRGGMYRIVEALAAIARKHGVEFEYDAAVEQILTSGNRATGVALRGGRSLEADVVVANAELGYVYDRLLPESSAARRIRRMEYGCGTVMFYWGLDKQYSDLRVHNIFFSGDYWSFFETLRRGAKWPDQPHFYVHAPARIDSDAAPAGHDAWVVAVPVCNTRKGNATGGEADLQRMRSVVLKRMAEAGFPDVSDHIVAEKAMGPSDWETRYNLPFGATHGLSHRLTQMGYFRPANRHARFQNLFFAGASTHPGTGIPMVLTSAGFAAKRIQDEIG